MIYRIQKIYSQKIPWAEVRLEEMKNPEFYINLNSFSLTIETFMRYLNDLVKFTYVMLSNTSKKPNEELLREYYIKSSRFYFIDKFIFASMFCADDDIYYLPSDHEKWKAIDSIRKEIKIDDDHKIFKLEEEYSE